MVKIYFKILPQQFLEETTENHEKHWSVLLVAQLKFKPGTAHCPNTYLKRCYYTNVLDLPI
jgi:hypothetical protein